MRAGRCGVMADGVVFRTLPTVLTILTVLACAQARQPSFQGLGDFPGWDFYSAAAAVSGDGNVVVGVSHSAWGREAFRWTETEGMVRLAIPGITLPDGWCRTVAMAVSADGSVIVGDYDEPDENSGTGYRTQPFRWTQAGGMVALPGMPADSMWVSAYDISADGSVLVGVAYGIAYRWTAETGAVDLGGLDGYTSNQAKGVSADGQVVAGGSSTGNSPREAWRWTVSDGPEGLGDLEGGSFHSVPTAISADGSTIVGFGHVEDPQEGGSWPEAFRWTAKEGMVGLGDLPGGPYLSIATDTSADGSVVIGYSHTSRGSEAFVWDEAHGMRRLCDILNDEFGIDMSAWTWTRARAISDDGTVIVGTGDNPSGDREAWVAVIPEPSALLFLASGMPLLTLRRSRVS